MVAIDLKSLVGKLTETGRRQLEAAAGLTLSRSHYNVEIEHVLLKLVELSGSDIATILRKQSVDAGQVAAELNRALDRLRTGNARPPALSPDIVTWLREAWIIASLEEGRVASLPIGQFEGFDLMERVRLRQSAIQSELAASRNGFGDLAPTRGPKPQ